MCGISGFSLSPNDSSITNSRRLAGHLLLGIEHRGKDATGACWISPTGAREVQKHPVTASAFVRNLSMWKKTNDAILTPACGLKVHPTTTTTIIPSQSAPSPVSTTVASGTTSNCSST